MKINKFIASSMTTAATIAAMLLTSGVAVNAATDADAPQTANDSASVQLTAGQLTFGKVDGSVSQPSFDFGSHQVGADPLTLNQTDDHTNKIDKTDTYTGSAVTVTDLRGSGAGWHVTAQLGDLADAAGHKIAGAQLSLGGGVITPSHVSAAQQANAPTESKITLTAAGSAATLLTAAKDKGMGEWTTDYGKSAGVTLLIPSADYAGTYVAPLTWTLAGTPTD